MLIDASPQDFFNCEDLICVVSTKQLGNQRTNHQILPNQLSIDPKKFIFAEQIHGSKVCTVGQKNRGDIIEECDGLITDEKDIYLFITVADCLPIFIFDSQKKICCVVHAGWKSLLKGVISKTVKQFITHYQSQIDDLLVFIGPGIGKCHFEVKEGVAVKFPTEVVTSQSKKLFIDLKEYAKIQFINKNIKSKNIKISDECTYCQKDKYFSYRRDKTEIIQAMAAIIGIKSND